MSTIRPNRARASGKASRPGGFTLIELMVTVAVVGILAVVGVPSMTALINANRLASASGNLTAALQLARSEAIRRGATVTICPSTDGTNCASDTDWSGWIVSGRDNAASEEEGSEVIDIIRYEVLAGAMELQGPEDGIEFRSSGLIDSEETLTVCLPTSYPAENQRVTTVLISGSIRTDRGSGGGSCT